MYITALLIHSPCVARITRVRLTQLTLKGWASLLNTRLTFLLPSMSCSLCSCTLACLSSIITLGLPLTPLKLRTSSYINSAWRWTFSHHHIDFILTDLSVLNKSFLSISVPCGISRHSHNRLVYFARCVTSQLVTRGKSRRWPCPATAKHRRVAWQGIEGASCDWQMCCHSDGPG